jgi:hypothetical protein
MNEYIESQTIRREFITPMCVFIQSETGTAVKNMNTIKPQKMCRLNGKTRLSALRSEINMLPYI